MHASAFRNCFKNGKLRYIRNNWSMEIKQYIYSVLFTTQAGCQRASVLVQYDILIDCTNSTSLIDHLSTLCNYLTTRHTLLSIANNPKWSQTELSKSEHIADR
eukprot:NODE_91_length_21779_cov_0.171356.p16 type:complete len:103 gc:universal NODE_91_length_21779_cov_0.171356:8522-8830(+)